ncbi:alpha/beta fold hydrolase [Promicromonospora panici]|uniref:alpha/beta fold hydrolase n=1 Tax=Promicromonospora panici TaxID=2219658 RepID=UPI001A917BDC|nr:alpha/beta hydrolase [Promicromonospora panici]
MRASFAYYRALDETITQNEQRKRTRLTLPVLAIGGAKYTGAAVAETMRLAADDVTGVVLDGCDHYVAQEQSTQFVEILEGSSLTNR